MTDYKHPLILPQTAFAMKANLAQREPQMLARWHEEDVLEIHPFDAEERGVADGDYVSIGSRMGATTLRAEISERMPQGVVYTTFHHPLSGANVITTEYSDWATNCPEYKVTAVQVSRSNRSASEWQVEREQMDETHYRVLAAE